MRLETIASAGQTRDRKCKSRRLSVKLGLWSLVCCLWSAVCSPVLAAPTISRIRVEGEFAVPKEQILDFLPFKTGESLHENDVQMAVENLKKWGIFDVIEASTDGSPEGIDVTFLLHQAEIISDIQITGNYPYVATRIRKRLNLQVGDMLEPKRLEEQKGRIKTFYERRGYYNTRVDVTAKHDVRENNSYVVFHIIKGERLRYSNIEIEGMKAFPEGRASRFLHTMDIYTEKRLREALRKMTDFYRSRGFLRAHIKVADKKIDWKTRRVSLKLAITEGPRIEIFFRGRPHYRRATLKKALGLYEEVNFDLVELQNSADQMIAFFKKDGFRKAKVAFKREKVGDDLYHIHYFIDPGVRSRVRHVRFTGNRSISGRKLRKQLLTKERSLTQKGFLNENFLKEDKNILEQYYQSKGFLNAQAGEPQVEWSRTRESITLLFPIEEDGKTIIKNTEFVGGEGSKKEEIFKYLKNENGKPINHVLLPYDREQVVRFFADNGYPYASVEQSVLMQDDQAVIRYSIDRGPLVRIGEVLMTGDILTGQRAILQAMEIAPGDVYGQKKIIDSQLSLRRLGPFNTVNIETIGLKEKKTTVHLRVKVEEKEPFVVAVDAQYSTDLKWAGNLKFTNLNTFGWGKQTSLLLRGGVKTSRAELSWFDPRFIGADIQTTLSSWMDYQKNPIETSLQTGGTTAFFHQYRRFGFLGRYELNRTYNLSGQALDPTVLRDATLSTITGQTSYDTRDSYSDPTRGVFLLGRGDLVNEIKGLQADFAKFKYAMVHYASPLKRLTLYQAFRLDSIQSIGSNISVPQIELFSLGGDDTVRGFREDVLGPVAGGRPTGGRSRFIYNAELHLRLVKSLQWAFFFDAGSLTNSVFDFDEDNIRRSAGFGLRYLTPVGPLRADYGIVLDRHAGENFGRLHITFGYPF